METEASWQLDEATLKAIIDGVAAKLGQADKDRGARRESGESSGGRGAEGGERATGGTLVAGG